MIASGSLQSALVHHTYTTIPREALAVLRGANVSGSVVLLPSGTLERSIYEDVDGALVAIGGKWHKGSRGHRFTFDPTHLLGGLVASGRMPEANATAFFPTPDLIVAEMLDEAGILEDDERTLRVLEPSAGLGAVADAVRLRAPNAHVICVEVLDLSVAALRARGHTVIQDDFTKYRTNVPFDKIVMNPPFSLNTDKNAYMTHCYHAWSMLADHGVLVAILPLGWTFSTTKAATQFREWVYEYQVHDYYELGTGAFKASGTMVSTLMITLRKDPDHVRRRELNGWHCWHCWMVRLYDDNDRASHKRLYDLIGREMTDDDYLNAIDKHIAQVRADNKLQIVLREACITDLRASYVRSRCEERAWIEASEAVMGPSTRTIKPDGDGQTVE